MTDDEIKLRWENDPKHRRKEYRDVFKYMLMCHCDRCTGIKPYKYLFWSYVGELGMIIKGWALKWRYR